MAVVVHDRHLDGVQQLPDEGERAPDVRDGSLGREEMLQRRHPGPSVHLQSWPEWNAELAKEEIITLVVQVNGKVRDRFQVAAGIDETTAKALALASPRVQKHIAGKTVRKVIFAAGKLVNVVAN